MSSARSVTRTNCQPPHRTQVGKRCEHKLRYRTYRRAWNAMALMFERGYAMQVIYPCAWCAGWHSTTGSPKYAPDLKPLAGVVALVQVPVHDPKGPPCP